LADAIVGAVGVFNGRRLGNLLKRLEGVPINGVEIARVGADKDGAIWRVSQTQNPPSL